MTHSSTTPILEFGFGTTHRNRVVHLVYHILIAILVEIT